MYLFNPNFKALYQIKYLKVLISCCITEKHKCKVNKFVNKKNSKPKYHLKLDFIFYQRLEYMSVIGYQPYSHIPKYV